MSSGFGVFGKLPDLGDFFRHNLPSKFVQAWDPWLQSAMIESKTALGTGWDDAYMSAPIWRFTLPAGMAGPHAMSGILMSSVDRVGRQYPLTLATPHDGPTALTHFANRTIYERLEDIALQVLDISGSRDALLSALEGTHLIAPAPVAQASLPYAGAQPAAQVLAAQSIQQTHGSASLWSAMMEGDHRLMACNGLPKGAEARALFDLSAPMWMGGGAAAGFAGDDLPPPLDDPIADLLGEG